MNERADVVAASFLGLGFAWVSYVAIGVEPSMGFESPADFFDPRKVAAGYTSWVWLVSNLLYLGFPVALTTIALSSTDSLLRWSGVASSLLWLTVGAIDRIGIQLPDFLATDEALFDALAATLPTRFAMLKAAVVTLGVFAWRTTRTGAAGGPATRVWRGFGWVVLGLSVAFLFAFVPVPVAFAIWGIALAARTTRAATGARVEAARH